MVREYQQSQRWFLRVLSQRSMTRMRLTMWSSFASELLRKRLFESAMSWTVRLWLNCKVAEAQEGWELTVLEATSVGICRLLSDCTTGVRMGRLCPSMERQVECALRAQSSELLPGLCLLHDYFFVLVNRFPWSSVVVTSSRSFVLRVCSWMPALDDMRHEVCHSHSSGSDRQPTNAPRPHQTRPFQLSCANTPPPPVTMSGSVQISSPAQLSSLLLSSRVVVVNCKMRRIYEPQRSTDYLCSLQRMEPGMQDDRPRL